MAAEQRPLPNAVSVGDELLVAVIRELQGLRADLASARTAAPQAAAPAVELREPKPAKVAKTPAKKQASTSDRKR